MGDSDYEARLKEVLHFILTAKSVADGNLLRCQGLSDENREVLRAAPQGIYRAFKEFAEKFIVPHIASNPALATRGCELAFLMMVNAFNTGAAALHTTHNELEVAEKKLRRVGSSRGGKNRQPKWLTEPRPYIAECISSDPNRSNAAIGRLLKKKFPKLVNDRTNEDLTERAIEGAIAKIRKEVSKNL
jgi:hypothetical protein